VKRVTELFNDLFVITFITSDPNDLSDNQKVTEGDVRALCAKHPRLKVLKLDCNSKFPSLDFLPQTLEKLDLTLPSYPANFTLTLANRQSSLTGLRLGGAPQTDNQSLSHLCHLKELRVLNYRYVEAESTPEFIKNLFTKKNFPHLEQVIFKGLFEENNAINVFNV
jgi:hypothetical protein